MNPIFADNVSQPEGPVVLDDGRIVLVEMGPERKSVTIVSPDGGRQTIIEHAGNPNGLAIDGDGCIWVAGGPGQSLIRLTPSGQTLLRIDSDGEREFLFPNDLAFGPDGLLYLTDSGTRLETMASKDRASDGFAHLDYDGAVYRIDPRNGRVISKIVSGVKFTNGIAFGPDGALYYNETLTGVIYRVDDKDRSEPYANVLRSTDPMQFRGPDGMAFADDGALYCTVLGEGHICVIAPDGDIEVRCATNGNYPTNVAFDLKKQLLYVTEVQNGAVETIATTRSGLPLHMPKVDR